MTFVALWRPAPTAAIPDGSSDGSREAPADETLGEALLRVARRAAACGLGVVPLAARERAEHHAGDDRCTSDTHRGQREPQEKVEFSRHWRSVIGSSEPEVFRLMRNSNLVGCSTGKSAGLAPLRIKSTK